MRRRVELRERGADVRVAHGAEPSAHAVRLLGEPRADRVHEHEVDEPAARDDAARSFRVRLGPEQTQDETERFVRMPGVPTHVE